MTHPAARILERQGGTSSGAKPADCTKRQLTDHRAWLVGQLETSKECQITGSPVSIGDATFVDPLKAIEAIHRAIRSVDELLFRECPVSIQHIEFDQWEDDPCWEVCGPHARHSRWRNPEWY